MKPMLSIPVALLMTVGLGVGTTFSMTRYVDAQDPTCGDQSPSYPAIQAAVDAAAVI